MMLPWHGRGSGFKSRRVHTTIRKPKVFLKSRLYLSYGKYITGDAMKIRKLREEDTGQIVAIIHDVMGPNDAKKALTDMKLSLLKQDSFKFEEFYVLEIEGEIVGAGGFWSLHYDPDIGRMDWFVVASKHQRKGFGKMLLNHIVAEARKRNLRMLVGETSDSKKYDVARNFFMKNGFEKTGAVKDYWEDGSGAVYMVKRLQSK